MGRDHSIECRDCGNYYGGLNEIPHDCTGPQRMFACRFCNGRVKSWCNKPGATAHDNCVWLIAECLDRLASNLAQAGALCRAHRNARLRWPLADRRDVAWNPGCGRDAP